MDKIIVLAAGKGTRMLSELPKVLVPLAGKPIIKYLMQSITESKTGAKPIVVVSPENKEMVMGALAEFDCDHVIQTEQLGTGHAVAAASGLFIDGIEKVAVLYGDHPFLKPETINKLMAVHQGVITMMTVKVEDFGDWRANFYHWGRIIRQDDEIKAIVEFKDANDEQRKITELNPSLFCFDARWLKDNLIKLRNENKQHEYYLTDLVGLAFSQGYRINNLVIDPAEAVGINTHEELNAAEKLLA